MKTLNVQIQPRLAPDLDVERVVERLDALPEHLAQDVDVERGDDDGPYVNVTCLSDDLTGLWKAIRTGLYDDPALGPALRRASIVVCEGKRGWDDYRMLHHFDPTVAVVREA